MYHNPVSCARAVEVSSNCSCCIRELWHGCYYPAATEVTRPPCCALAKFSALRKCFGTNNENYPAIIWPLLVLPDVDEPHVKVILLSYVALHASKETYCNFRSALAAVAAAEHSE